ncbi:hypothetical protein J2W28_005036 [Variovorax boronicumulans]|nr:hypothetical protein [Variovorax boronicumulans]MDQ0044490.1 hypothetical protein [Variovorax boronicumulans]
MWKLLRADRGPVIAALLENLLLRDEKVLFASSLEERLTRDIETLRAQGYDLPFAATAYIREWIDQGWLSRRLASGAPEEEISLTTDAANAVRFIVGATETRRTATQSRLATVISRLQKLAEETDGNRQSRLASLLEQRDRIDREIERVNNGQVTTLADDLALESARDIIFLAEELISDFRQVRDEFEHLNRDLRATLMDHEGSRGHVLEKLFSGVDVIGDSEAGRTFQAFWRLLNDYEQSAILDDSVDALNSRSFARNLRGADRRMLRNLTGLLLKEGSTVHEVQQSFARGLKHFVQSREFMENRRLHHLLSAAQRGAVQAKDQLRTTANIGFTLTSTGARMASVAQWGLLDPNMRMEVAAMEKVPEGELSLSKIAEMVQRSEINLRALKRNIHTLLETKEVVSLSDLLERFDAEQGLGSVVGYLSLAAKHGQIFDDNPCPIEWTGADGLRRRATAPTVFFHRDQLHALQL